MIATYEIIIYIVTLTYSNFWLQINEYQAFTVYFQVCTYGHVAQ